MIDPCGAKNRVATGPDLRDPEAPGDVFIDNTPDPPSDRGDAC